MDIILINPYNQESHGINETTVEVPVGLLSLSSFLEKDGISVGLLDANAMCMPQAKLLEIIKNKPPRVIGIYVNIFSFIQAIRYTEEIKRFSKDITVVWGGPHATIAPDICFDKSKVDLIVIGEGELTLLEIMKNILKNGSLNNISNIKGLAFRAGGGFKINSPRERITNLDDLPLPAYHLLPELKYYKTRARRMPFMGIITSRGCFHNCIYCSKDVFKNRVTLRSAENIINEIDILVKKFNIRQVDILDDNFTVDISRVDRLCELIIKRKYKIFISLQSGIRADKANEKILKKMRMAGVFKLAFGVETGNTNILKEIKKELDLNKVLEACYLARKEGIIVIGFFMIGLPGENEDTLKETIDFAVRMNPHIANFMMTIPFYGTELYRRIVKEGRLLVDTKNGISSGFYAAEAYYELGALNSSLMLKYYKKAYRDFYFRFTKVLDLLWTVRSLGELSWLLKTGISIIFPKK